MEQDIRTLRFIRMLRMLDVPLPVIRSVLAGDASLGSVLREQKTALEQRAKQLEGAARFCAELARQDPSVASLDVDACLTRMEKACRTGCVLFWLAAGLPHAGTGAAPEAFFLYSGGQHQHPAGSSQRPCRPTQRPTGCSSALKNEGMYPEFSLDGIPYKAYRNPGKYRDEICCDAVHPEQLDTGLPSRREKLLRIARIVLPPVCTFAAIMAAGWVVTGGAGWLWLAALASGGVLLGRCMEKWL